MPKPPKPTPKISAGAVKASKQRNLTSKHNAHRHQTHVDRKRALKRGQEKNYKLPSGL